MILHYKPAECEGKDSLKGFLGFVSDELHKNFPNEVISIVCSRGDLTVLEGNLEILVVDGTTFTAEQVIEAVREKLGRDSQ